MKHIAWISALIILFLAGDRLSGLVLERLVRTSGFRYSRLYQKEAEAQILLVGNSRGLTFFQPAIERLTGASTFNLSYNAMPMNLCRVLIADYYDRYPAPSHLLIDITLCDRYNEALMSGFNCYTPYSRRLEDSLYGIAPETVIGGKISHLYRYNSEVFQRALYYSGKDHDEDWLLDRVIQSDMAKNVATFPADSLQILPDMIAQLVETVNFARSKGTKVLLLINPYYPPFVQRLGNLDSYRSWIERKTGMLVHDYSTAIQGEAYFGDYQHLNKSGSEKYMELLWKDGLLGP